VSGKSLPVEVLPQGHRVRRHGFDRGTNNTVTSHFLKSSSARAETASIMVISGALSKRHCAQYAADGRKFHKLTTADDKGCVSGPGRDRIVSVSQTPGMSRNVRRTKRPRARRKDCFRAQLCSPVISSDGYAAVLGGCALHVIHVVLCSSRCHLCSSRKRSEYAGDDVGGNLGSVDVRSPYTSPSRNPDK
jgi:hypothetical protein